VRERSRGKDAQVGSVAVLEADLEAEARLAGARPRREDVRPDDVDADDRVRPKVAREVDVLRPEAAADVEKTRAVVDAAPGGEVADQVLGRAQVVAAIFPEAEVEVAPVAVAEAGGADRIERLDARSSSEFHGQGVHRRSGAEPRGAFTESSPRPDPLPLPSPASADPSPGRSTGRAVGTVPSPLLHATRGGSRRMMLHAAFSKHTRMRADSSIAVGTVERRSANRHCSSERHRGSLLSDRASAIKHSSRRGVRYGKAMVGCQPSLSARAPTWGAARRWVRAPCRQPEPTSRRTRFAEQG